MDLLVSNPQHQDRSANEQSSELQPLTEDQHVDAFITDMGISHFLYC